MVQVTAMGPYASSAKAGVWEIVLSKSNGRDDDLCVTMIFHLSWSPYPLTIQQARDLALVLQALGLGPVPPPKPEGQCTCDVRDLMIRGCKCGVK
jgi:hypothetical protein